MILPYFNIPTPHTPHTCTHTLTPYPQLQDFREENHPLTYVPDLHVPLLQPNLSSLCRKLWIFPALVLLNATPYLHTHTNTYELTIRIPTILIPRAFKTSIFLYITLISWEGLGTRLGPNLIAPPGIVRYTWNMHEYPKMTFPAGPRIIYVYMYVDEFYIKLYSWLSLLLWQDIPTCTSTTHQRLLCFHFPYCSLWSYCCTLQVSWLIEL